MSSREEVVQQIGRLAQQLAFGSDDILYEEVAQHAERMLKEPWAIKEIERALKRELKLALQDTTWADELLDSLFLGDELAKELSKRVKLVIE